MGTKAQVRLFRPLASAIRPKGTRAGHAQAGGARGGTFETWPGCTCTAQGGLVAFTGGKQAVARTKWNATCK